jgi:hypothetical protein
MCEALRTDISASVAAFVALTTFATLPACAHQERCRYEPSSERLASAIGDGGKDICASSAKKTETCARDCVDS